MEYRTYDGVPVTVGLRVFTNDWEWGTVVETEASRMYPREDPDAWHKVKLDSGRTNIYNRDRLTTREPK